MKIRKRLKKQMLSIVLCVTMLLTCLPLPVSAAGDGLSDDIVILYTNDVHTYIDGELSYDVIAALKADLQNEYRYVLLVDAGDHIQGTAYGSMDKGESIIELMNAADYDVATLGNHEFDYNMQGCMNAIEWAEFSYISCNFYHEENGVRGENVLDSYMIFECGEEKIAFVGITTPETFSKTTPAYFQNEDGEYIYGISGGEDGSELQQDVQQAIEDAKADGATRVIALGHLGEDLSSSPWTSEETIAAVSGLDAFIDGHSHTVTEAKNVKDKDGNDVLLTQTGEYFNRIGMMVIDSETGDITTDFIECVSDGDGYVLSSELYGGTEVISDASVKAIKDKWIQEIDEMLGENIGSTELTFDNYDSDGNRLVRIQETNSGDFAADAIYYLFDNMGMDVDVAVMNGGGVRNGTVTGDISYKTCKTVHPFGNVACLQTVTGRQIFDMLEWGARKVGVSENGSFLQVSGLTYKIDTSIPDTTQADDKDIWISGPEEYRVYDVMIYNKDTGEWEELDLEAEYNLAGYNYTLRDLGDGFAMLDDAVNVLDYVMEDYMVLANYIKGFENGIIEADNSPLLEKYPGLLIDYSDVNGSGRIEVVSEAEDDDIEILVGNVKVTGDNEDVLGDGTVSYVAATNTLILNGADITTEIEYYEDFSVGICSMSDLNIELIGDNKITSSGLATYSYGIYVEGDLNISGSGSVIVNGGEITSGEGQAVVGICVTGQLHISEASVTANGGNVISEGEEIAYSFGTHAIGGIEIDNGGALISIGGKAQAEYAYSGGITVYYAENKNICVYDGYIYAESNDAVGTVYADSCGLEVMDGSLYIYGEEANVSIVAGNAIIADSEQEIYGAYSGGIYIEGGDMVVKAGTVNVTSGSVIGDYGEACGVYIISKEKTDDAGNTYTVGGNLYVECDEVLPGTYGPKLRGTTININSPNGRAVYASSGIRIGDKLTVSVPENGMVSLENYWDFDERWTIIDADGTVAQNVSINPLGYTVYIKGTGYEMAVPVPAGQSINETYCELYGVNDFSEIINTEKEGYTFGGWYTDEACTDGNEYDFDDIITADITIYAKWISMTDGGDDADLPDTPKTGDNGSMALWFALLIVSGCAVMTVTVYGKKRKIVKR